MKIFHRKYHRLSNLLRNTGSSIHEDVRSRSFRVNSNRFCNLDESFYIEDASVILGKLRLRNPPTTNSSISIIKMLSNSDTMKEITSANRVGVEAVYGVGEIAPLPGLSKENIDEAYEEALSVSKQLIGTHFKLADMIEPSFMSSLSSITSPVPPQKYLPPSVVSGYEQALMVAVSRIQNVSLGSLFVSLVASTLPNPTQPIRSTTVLEDNNNNDNEDSSQLSFSSLSSVEIPRTINVNGLVVSQGLECDSVQEVIERIEEGYTCLKVKVGRRGSPKEDGKILSSICKELGRIEQNMGSTQGGKEALKKITLRADANRAWSFEEALQFESSLSSEAKVRLEYIEEPCVSPEDTLRFSAHTGLGVGLDESIDEGWLEQNTSKEYIKSCESDNNDDHKIHGSPKIKALILKPTILGGHKNDGGVLESARTISTARNKFGPPYLSSPVLSSSFETPYTLLYFAQIAGGMAALEKIGISVSFKNSPAHGIGTSNWYASDQNQADSDSRKIGTFAE
eukprot:jgi/Bigna1/85193/estExt_fgenesh1_pg.C_20401